MTDHGSLKHLPLLLDEALHLASMLCHLDAPPLGIHLLQPVLLGKALHGLPPELILLLLLPCHPFCLHPTSSLSDYTSLQLDLDYATSPHITTGCKHAVGALPHACVLDCKPKVTMSQLLSICCNIRSHMSSIKARELVNDSALTKQGLGICCIHGLHSWSAIIQWQSKYAGRQARRLALSCICLSLAASMSALACSCLRCRATASLRHSKHQTPQHTTLASYLSPS